MIHQKQIGWLTEFLHGLCENDADRGEADDIADTFRKLWSVAKAAEHNPYPRSPRLTEALASIKESEQGKAAFRIK